MTIPSKEVLKTAVDALIKMNELEDRWQGTFDEMFDSCFVVPSYFNEPRNAIVHMIEMTFNDNSTESFGSHFSWWCYETDFGRNDLADSVTDSTTGENIPMRTVDDLYNYYIKYTLNTNGNK